MRIVLVMPLAAMCAFFSTTAQGEDAPPRYVVSCGTDKCVIKSNDIIIKLQGVWKSPMISILSFSGEVDDGAASVPAAMNSERERILLKPNQVLLFPKEWVADSRGNRLIGGWPGYFLIDNQSGLIRHYDRQSDTNVIISLRDLIDRLVKTPSIFIESSIPRGDLVFSVRDNYESHSFVKALRKAIGKLPR